MSVGNMIIGIICLLFVLFVLSAIIVFAPVVLIVIFAIGFITWVLNGIF